MDKKFWKRINNRIEYLKEQIFDEIITQFLLISHQSTKNSK